MNFSLFMNIPASPGGRAGRQAGRLAYHAQRLRAFKWEPRSQAFRKAYLKIKKI